MSESASVLVVAAHPDDEVLGCGGTISAHAAAGDTVHILFVADGVGARHGGKPAAESIEPRRRMARQAAEIMAAGEPRFLDFPDNRLDSVPLLDVIQAIEPVFAELRPDIVYTHQAGDLNIDHRIVHQAVLTAGRPMPGLSVTALYGFEVPSSTNWADPASTSPFTPNRYVDISPHFERKLQALNCYESEIRPFPHARSVEAITALATYRGTSVGLKSAEAFMCIREIVS